MTVLVFAGALLAAVFLSKLASRSVISTAVLFLLAGFAGGALGWLRDDPASPLVETLSELALFSVLFTDGMKLRFPKLVPALRLPGRALLFGMPLTLGGTAVLAHYVAGVPWLEALLLGAVLSPTDPVFAAAVVEREAVPQRLRDLLNIESGVNDGLALPFVTLSLAAAASRPIGPVKLAVEVASGLALGVVVPLAAAGLARCRPLATARPYEPLFGFSVGLLVFALTSVLHANVYLGAFTAGITLATVHPSVTEDFRPFGEPLTELAKLSAILVFGALVSPAVLREIGGRGYAFAALTLLLARPAALGLALLGARLPAREKLTALWFGPKGFASVVFGLMVLRSPITSAERLFHLIALVVAVSIVVYSSTDVFVARWLQRARQGDEAKPAAE